MINLNFTTPAVISASRATDIPAFHADWLLDRLEAGYCDWSNPFNAGQVQRVLFKHCKAFVFWSKNPAPLMPHLHKFDAKGIRYYFQFTVNDYEKEGLEPGIPPLAARIEIFKTLARICPVIWRYDPVIMGSGLEIREHLERIKALMADLAEHTEKLVFSFVDIQSYRNVARRLEKFNPEFREPKPDEMERFVEGLANLNNSLDKPLKLGICGEKPDFARFGIAKNRCIDPDILEKIALPSANTLVAVKQFDHLKDKGQRKLCGCVRSKDIGSYRKHSCGHHCVYCYAGHGKSV